MVRSHSGARDMGDDHPEGSRDPEFEVVNGEVVGPEVGAVSVKELNLEERKGEEPLTIVVKLPSHDHPLRMRSDLNVADQEALADIDERPVTKGVLG